MAYLDPSVGTITITLAGLATDEQDSDDPGDRPDSVPLGAIIEIAAVVGSDWLNINNIGVVALPHKYAYIPASWDSVTKLNGIPVSGVWPMKKHLSNIADPDIPTDAYQYRFTVSAYSQDGKMVGAAQSGIIDSTEEGGVYNLLDYMTVSVITPLSSAIKGPKGDKGEPGPPGSGSLTWSTIAEKPTVIAAGDTPAAARASISAVSDSDSRLTDSRVPTAHTHTPADVTGTAVVTTDPRLADARTPLAHTHTAANITDFTEATQDVVGAMVTGAGGTYDDAAGAITLPSGGGAVLSPSSPRGWLHEFVTGYGSDSDWAYYHAKAHVFFAPNPLRIDALRVYFYTGVAGAKIGLGVYSSWPSGRVKSLLSQVAGIPAETAGWVEAVLPAPLDLPAGIYWLASRSDGTTVPGRTMSVGAPSVTTTPPTYRVGRWPLPQNVFGTVVLGQAFKESYADVDIALTNRMHPIVEVRTA